VQPADTTTANNAVPEKQEEPYDPAKVNAFDRFFEITKRKSKLSTEIIAGLVTFLSMSYILSTNPNVLVGDTLPTLWNSVYIATALASAVSTLVMAFVAHMPFALAPGFNLFD
jgi:AGZA family xanthine/uracil permease-like MFS transporter